MKDNTLSYMSGDGVNRGTNKFAGNMHSGVQNPNAMINKGRGPTVGNKSDDDSTYPDAARLPKFSAGKDMFMGSSNPQVRNPSGTKEMPKCGRESFNFSRGPTKGNQV